MDRTERFYRIDQLLHERRVVPLPTFLDALGVSRATFKRDLEYLRDRLHAPIVFPYSDDRELLADILKHGDQVEVLAPRALRAKVHAAHLAGAERNA